MLIAAFSLLCIPANFYVGSAILAIAYLAVGAQFRGMFNSLSRGQRIIEHQEKIRAVLEDTNLSPEERLKQAKKLASVTKV